VLLDGMVIGRIYEKAGLASHPSSVGSGRSITDIVPAIPNRTNGHAATLEEAKIRFRAAWEKAKAGRRHRLGGPVEPPLRSKILRPPL
jgi:hypothetical protein